MTSNGTRSGKSGKRRVVMPDRRETEVEAAHFAARYAAGRPHALGPGARPAVLVVDFIEGFTHVESPLGGPWDDEVAAAAKLVRSAGDAGVPVLFTTVEFRPNDLRTNLLALKSPGIAILTAGSKWTAIDHRLPRNEHDIVISKKYGSAFFATSLSAQLQVLGVDTLFVAGCVTSGCVRASVVDAVQSGFRPLVVREAVGDRSPLANEANLQDIEQRYGDVVSLEEAVRHLREGRETAGAAARR